MREYKIRCPKCSHEQQGGAECEACGIIFARYAQYQKRKNKEQVSATTEGVKKGGKGLSAVLQILLVVALTAGVTYWFVKPESSDKRVEVAKLTEGSTGEKIVAPKLSSTGQGSEKATRQVSESRSHGGTIEQARKATVSIETPWGTGSGFFVTDSYIVTNRHVIEINQAELDEFRRKIEATRELVELEKDKLRDLRSRMHGLNKGPTRSQIKIVIEERERELNRVLPELEEAERRLVKMEADVQPSDIKIVLADGSSHEADFLLVSDTHDLALMSLIANDVQYLRRPPATYKIRQGDKVFTIGSPVGLRNTVTSGVFSGYRRDNADGKLFLQTDAAINPGNSGGPLIDEKGYVHGVNTMILQNTEGIGFAIPIETVFQEFGSSLY